MNCKSFGDLHRSCSSPLSRNEGVISMKVERQLADVLFRNSFGAFFYRAFEILNPEKRLIPNWHIEAVCHAVEQMVKGESGNRLVINLPPRTLKSQIVSVCLPAWLLGRDPAVRIICA